MTNETNDSIRIDRRRFLGSSALGAAATFTAPAWLPRVARAGTASTGRDTVVIVFLRGGSDGLTMCAPHADPRLYALRPTLAIQPPGAPNGAVDLDGFFGFAPAMAPLLPAYQAGRLAVVHATGLQDPSRSHFDMQRWMEFGVDGVGSNGVFSGWGGRYLQTIAPVGAGQLRGLAIEKTIPRSMAGGPACTAAPTPGSFVMPGSASTATVRRATITTMHTGEPFPLGPAALNTFATMDLLATIDFTNYVPSNGALYPTTSFGAKLESAAALIKADIGVELVEADLGGWDHHNQLGPLNGQMATLMDELSRALAAFDLDMSDGTHAIRRTTVVVMSEFGRRASENASAGTDHGHGNCMLVLGGSVNGGQVLSLWPTLNANALDNGDLAITMDYRDILAEILSERMGCTSLPSVFPGFTPTVRGIVS